MDGTLIHFTTNHLNNYLLIPYVNTHTDKTGYVTVDKGDYIRFIDRNGLVYIVPREHTISRLVNGKVVYYVNGTYYIDMGCTKHDLDCLVRFIAMAELHS